MLSNVGIDESNAINMNQKELVSVIHKCQSHEAKKLCIHDVSCKLKHSRYYDIGGTYTGTESDLWFYLTTTALSENNFLMNLFVCQRKCGDVFITTVYRGVSQTHVLKSSRPDENHHLRTLCIMSDDLKMMGDMYLPISIEINPSSLVNHEVIKKIKFKHSLTEQILKQEKTDFILVSADKKEFPVHKFILAAHSSVLRELIRNSTKASESLDLPNEDMELLLEFLYSGTIKEIKEKDCIRLQEIAQMFQLSNLMLLAQFAISNQINMNNVVQIASFAKKYKLDKLWYEACNFFRANPEVLETESWKTLEDVELVKQLCSVMIK